MEMRDWASSADRAGRVSFRHRASVRDGSFFVVHFFLKVYSQQSPRRAGMGSALGLLLETQKTEPGFHPSRIHPYRAAGCCIALRPAALHFRCHFSPFRRKLIGYFREISAKQDFPAFYRHIPNLLFPPPDTVVFSFYGKGKQSR